MDKYIKQDIWNYIRITSMLDKYLMGHKGFVAGGVFKNLFNNEPFKDIDIFFRNNEDFLMALDKFEKDEKYHKYYSNKKVQAFKHKETNVTVELIKHKFGEPQDIIDNFDFTITKVAYVNNFKTEDEVEKMIEELGEDEELEFEKSFLLIHKDFFEHLHTKRLVVDDKMVLPINTFERMFRYAKYGYFPCRETKVKIISTIRELESFSEELISMGLYDGMD